MNRPLSDDEIVERLKSSRHGARALAAVLGARGAARAGGRRRRSPAPIRVGRPTRVDGQRAGCGGHGRAARAATLAGARPTCPAVAPGQTVAETGTLDEDSWTFVASLGGDLDVETAAGAGLLAPGETTDRAVQALDADERAEVATLLQRALDGSEI